MQTDFMADLCEGYEEAKMYGDEDPGRDLREAQVAEDEDGRARPDPFP